MGSVCATNKPLEDFRGREERKETDMSAHLFHSGSASMVPIKYIVLCEICSFSMFQAAGTKQWGGTDFGGGSGK